jgi:alpha-ketoglutaric semialdehyde dehydrogenase
MAEPHGGETARIGARGRECSRLRLSSSIYTNDLRTAFRYAEESQAGMLHVNIPTLGGEAQVPFGGVKDSGFGDRECGTAAFDFFSEQRVVYVGY